MIDTLRHVATPIHREGLPFILAFALASLLLGALWAPLGWIGGVATAWCVYFFRDPDRVAPTREGLIVSPADGKVILIQDVVPPAELDLGMAPRTRISVFLNVFDVHVNRYPIAGRVAKVHYHPGKFLNASLDKASEDNERNGIKLELPGGRDLGVVQIAGLVARRIVSVAEAGHEAKTGERFGIIRFGSRADIYLPHGVQPMVCIGQRCVGGETVLADIQSTEPARIGVVAP